MKTFFPIIFLLCLAATLSHGQIPQEISYQGVLTDADGGPAGDGNYSMTFTLYDAETEGNSLWQEAKVVAVENGVFNVILGDVTPLSPTFDEAYWLGIQVGADPELEPRIKLTATAYSLNSEKVGGFTVSPTPSPNTLLPLDSRGQIPASALAALPTVNMGGVRTDSSVIVTTTSFAEIASFTIDERSGFDAYLSGALVAEINGNGTGRYDFRIQRETPSGPTVAQAWWRPGSAETRQAQTFTLNGVDSSRPSGGPTTYYLVARKFDSAAKDLFIFLYNLNALWVTNP